MSRRAVLRLAAALILALLGLVPESRALNRVGPEFRVNGLVNFYQYTPSVAMGNDGGFVVVWQSGTWGYGYGSGDGSLWGIFGRRFDGNGAPQDFDFQINTYTTGGQVRPAVARVPNGGFVVVWASFAYAAGGQDGHFYGVFGQRFDASGSRVGDEFQVNTFTTGSQVAPDIAVGPGGEFVVTWVSFDPQSFLAGGQDGSAFGIFGQRFDATAGRLGSEFQVNTYTTGVQTSSSVAKDGAGNFVVVWESSYPTYQDGSGPGIFGQRFDVSGNRLGSEFRVNAYTTSSQSSASVAAEPSGNFIVTWTGANQDGPDDGIIAQRFNASGVRLGAEFVVNTYTTSWQERPKVAANSDGFVVTWSSWYQDSSGYGVFGQAFARSGARLGPETRVNTLPDFLQDRSDVALDAHGRFVVAWSGFTFYDNAGVDAQRFHMEVEREGRALDFHKDGKSDLLWYNQATGQTALWKMSGASASGSGIATVSDLNWRIVGGADFGGDGKADLLWRHQKTGQTFLWQMNGNVPLSKPLGTVPDLNWEVAGTGDIGGDGKADIIWRRHDTGQLAIWNMNGAALQSVVWVNFGGDANAFLIALRDFDKDGKVDMLWRDRNTGLVYLWPMDGPNLKSFDIVANMPDFRWRLVAVGDFNSDGRNDLVWHHEQTGEVQIWLMLGGGSYFSTPLAMVSDTNWQILGCGDFNGNGKPDLLWYHRGTAQTYVWLMNGASIASISPVATVSNRDWVLQRLY